MLGGHIQCISEEISFIELCLTFSAIIYIYWLDYKGQFDLFIDTLQYSCKVLWWVPRSHFLQCTVLYSTGHSAEGRSRHVIWAKIRDDWNCNLFKKIKNEASRCSKNFFHLQRIILCMNAMYNPLDIHHIPLLTHHLVLMSSTMTGCLIRSWFFIITISSKTPLQGESLLTDSIRLG